jgi:hypothetical protein
MVKRIAGGKLDSNYFDNSTVSYFDGEKECLVFEEKN